MVSPSKDAEDGSDDRGCVLFIGMALVCWGAYLVFGTLPAGVCLMAFGLVLAMLAIFGK
jgi:hypothetical protein